MIPRSVQCGGSIDIDGFMQAAALLDQFAFSCCMYSVLRVWRADVHAGWYFNVAMGKH